MTDDKKITVQRTIDAPAKDIFEVLTLPSRHAELDGSGFVRSDSKTDRITATGQVFTMNMHGDHMGGDYQTDNHVTGYEWMWELEPQGQDSTLVTLTYDWSKVTDKQLLQKVHFPLVPQHDLEESLEKLAGAVSGG